MIEKEFIVPDYYEKFFCKGNACRKCCCAGWTVTVSMKEYFSLLGVDCAPETRRKLDIALHVLPDADEDRYACISPAYDGVCPLRRKEDGYCILQCECGEDALPAVCRYYPRSPRLYPAPECCVSNSCEKVVEDLLSSDEKLTFTHRTLRFAFDDRERNDYPKNAAEARDECARLLTDREKPLRARIDAIVSYLRKNDAGAAPDEDALRASLLSFYSDSSSIGEMCESALASGRSAAEDAKLVAKNVLQADVYGEKILANHFFFTKFPYAEPGHDPSDAGLALLGLFLLWNALLADRKQCDDQSFVDVTSELFRVAEHTRFYKNAAVLAKRETK